MKHLGDITKIDGGKVPIVDVITGGSPCQDLSVAGKRAGLDGERSGLFMEQVRIVKEMREHDRQLHGGRTDVPLRPRYMVWENVPGAFSSNGGKDFQAVLTEIARVADPECPDVPMPEKGKWSKSGCIYDELGRWSIAWRLHDAQFWGVAQRRKRIALVADFGGLSAPEVLFERKGLRRDSEAGGEERKGAAGTAAESVGGTEFMGRNGAYREGCISFQERAGKPGGGKGILIQHEHVGALSTVNNQRVLGLNDQGGSFMNVTEDVTGTLRAQTHGHEPIVCYGTSSHDGGGNPACNQGGIVVLEGNGSRPSHKGDGYKESEVMYTLNSTEQHGVAMAAGFCTEHSEKSRGIGYEEEKAPTLRAGVVPGVLSVENHPSDSRVKIRDDEKVQTLSAKMGMGGGNVPLVLESKKEHESVTHNGR